MALRYLYRELSSSRRRCRGCGKTIRRNIALHKGELWHYGCLQEARQKRYRCLDCGAILSRLELVEGSSLGVDYLACGSCGSTRIRTLREWRPVPIGIGRVAI